jgi:hypothetical protein
MLDLEGLSILRAQPPVDLIAVHVVGAVLRSFVKANELNPVIPIVDWRSLSELISCCYSQPRILVALHLINNRLANRDLIRRLLGEESANHSGIGPP